MLGVALVTLVIGLTISAYYLKQAILGIASAFAWGLLAMYAYTNSTVTWDVYYGLFWFSIAMALAVGLQSALMNFNLWREKSEAQEKQEINKKKDVEKTANGERRFESHIDRVRREHGLPPSEVKERRKNRRLLG